MLALFNPRGGVQLLSVGEKGGDDRGGSWGGWRRQTKRRSKHRAEGRRGGRGRGRAEASAEGGQLDSGVGGRADRGRAPRPRPVRRRHIPAAAVCAKFCLLLDEYQ